MGRCFVIQPFDGGAFDKRYEDVFAPAIKTAGLDPYRVDRDPGVTIPIEAIEDEIRNADVCLADISLDNPNVWYELGYALASRKDVIMVSGPDRKTRFPFDVQHRTIITYTTESSRDFENLKASIVDKIGAILRKERRIAQISDLSPTKPVEGLTPHETALLVGIFQSVDAPDEAISSYTVHEDMSRFGFNKMATNLAIRSAARKGLIAKTEDEDSYGNRVFSYSVTNEGMDWLEQNQNRLILQNEPRPAPAPSRKAPPAPDDDDLDETDPFADE